MCTFLLNRKIHLLWCFHFRSLLYPKLSWLNQPLQTTPEESREGAAAQNDMGNEGRNEILKVKRDSPKAICYRLYYLSSLHVG